MKKSSQKLNSFFERYVAFAEKSPLTIILIALVVAGLAIIPISKIRLDAALDKLLPQDTPTIKAMKETNKRFGSADLFMIAIQMDDPIEIAKVQDEIKQEMEKNWEDVLYVQVNRDNSFFVKHALLYLPVPHLEHIVDNLTDIQMELGVENTPFMTDLLEDEPGMKEERKWFDASLPQELGLPDEAAEAFASFFKPKKSEDAETNAPEKKKFNPKAGLPDSMQNRLIGRHKDGTVNGVVQAALKYPSSNTDYVKEVIARTNKMLAPIKARYGDKIDVGVEGSYNQLQDVASLAMNGVVATIISLVLIVAVIIIFFRSIGAVLVILLQVTITCCYTLGVAGMVYGRLNLYTVFVIAILLGMGIDYSIHVMGHAQKAARKGSSWKDAFTHTLQVLFHPMSLAAITTIAGLLTLLSAEFVGFYEFGVIASVGIFFSILSAMFLLPALVFLFQKGKGIPVLAWFSLPVHQPKSLLPSFLKVNDWHRVLKPGVVVVIVLVAFLTIFIPQADFEHDFRNLRDTRKSYDSKRHTGVAIQSKRKSSQPVVALAKDPKTLIALHDTLLHRLTVEKDPILRSFLTLTTFVPAEGDQEERVEVIEEIADLINARVFSRAQGEDSSMIHLLRNMTDIEAFTAEDIPPWALRLVQERDGSYGRIAFIYGGFKSSDALEAAKFQDRYGTFHLNGEDVVLYSSSFIYADIIRMVKQDSRKMAWLISLIIVLTLTLTLRSWKLILIAVLGLGAGAVAMVGLLGLTGAKLGPFNLIVIPTILGVSIDSIIHLTIAYRRYGEKKLNDLFLVTGSLVTASVVTTLAGYAGMLFTTHQGIETIGILAIIGFSACLATALFLTPWLSIKLKVK
ncbi:MAG: MMPL family transporter [Fibrobacteria bacterium]|nr:MMPL family transporter [Fibrobacteria bacterium]